MFIYQGLNWMYIEGMNVQVFEWFISFWQGGNFIGWMYIDAVNVSVALVENGLSKVHFTAERSPHYSTLLRAEEKAKKEKLGVSSCTILFYF